MRATTALGLLGGLAIFVTPVRAADLSGKKLIEFGWDEPGTAFMRSHITEMQQTPFDGCVFHIDYQKTTGEKGSFTWKAWGEHAFTEADLREAFADLQAIDFGKFKHNFLRFNTTPGKLDWFDDHGAVISNAKLAAQLARVGRGPGILFDIEQYEGQLFDYSKQRDAKSKSWEVYAAQARLRGQEVMEAFQAGYPGLTVFLTFGYSLPWAQSARGKKPLAECGYGLLAPFMDGLVAAARGSTRIVEGYELSYSYKAADQFSKARKTVQQDLLPIVREPDKYQRLLSLSFGIWLDHDWRKLGWDAEHPEKNYFSPEAFETSVRAALQVADNYVWVYSETPRWWSAEGKAVKLPTAYQEALEKARRN